MRSIVLSLMICAAPVAAMSPQRDAIENDLVPQVQFVGEEVDNPSISERQAALGVNYVSVAVWREGKVEWSAAYGDGITADTRFQAASLSKPVAAIAIAALAAERGISLDADISPVLGQSLDMAVVNPEGIDITLRGLLSHTAGATVGGFPGYADGVDVPDLVSVLTGKGNSDQVVIEAAQAGTFRYAGGGYELAELWAETVSGEAFDVIVDRLVLGPIGMTRSTFAPLERGLPLAEVAPAQDGSGDAVPGGWNVYPEQAAASLWTTAPDFARFMGAYMAALRGEHKGIDPAIAKDAVIVIDNEYGLGIGVADIEGQMRLSHSGSNRGYKSNFMAYPALGEAIVAFANHDRGWQIVGDIGRTANVTYGWPHRPIEKVERVAVDLALLERLAGPYTGPDGSLLFTVIAGGPNLSVDIAGQGVTDFIPISGERFIDPADGQIVTWRFEEDGRAVLMADGNEYPQAAE